MRKRKDPLTAYQEVLSRTRGLPSSTRELFTLKRRLIRAVLRTFPPSSLREEALSVIKLYAWTRKKDPIPPSTIKAVSRRLLHFHPRSPILGVNKVKGLFPITSFYCPFCEHHLFFCLDCEWAEVNGKCSHSESVWARVRDSLYYALQDAKKKEKKEKEKERKRVIVVRRRSS